MSLELELVRAYRRYVEHLSGQHNQKSHARRYGSAADIKATVKRAAGDKEELKAFAAKAKKRLRKDIKSADSTLFSMYSSDKDALTKLPPSFTGAQAKRIAGNDAMQSIVNNKLARRVSGVGDDATFVLTSKGVAAQRKLKDRAPVGTGKKKRRQIKKQDEKQISPRQQAKKLNQERQKRREKAQKDLAIARKPLEDIDRKIRELPDNAPMDIRKNLMNKRTLAKARFDKIASDDEADRKKHNQAIRQLRGTI